jgi:hypothetical protein
MVEFYRARILTVLRTAGSYGRPPLGPRVRSASGGLYLARTVGRGTMRESGTSDLETKPNRGRSAGHTHPAPIALDRYHDVLRAIDQRFA